LERSGLLPLFLTGWLRNRKKLPADRHLSSKSGSKLPHSKAKAATCRSTLKGGVALIFSLLFPSWRHAWLLQPRWAVKSKKSFRSAEPATDAYTQAASNRIRALPGGQYRESRPPSSLACGPLLLRSGWFPLLS
jgi:hypothetical protein